MDSKQELKNIDNVLALAVVGSQFDIIYANVAFYDLTSDNYFHSAYSVMDDESVKEVQDIVAGLSVGSTAETLISLKDGGSAFLQIYYKKENIYELRACPVGKIIEEMLAEQWTIQRGRMMLSMMGDALFEYNAEQDLFRLYWIADGQDVTFYHGSLDKWVRKNVAEGNVEQGDIGLLQDFCNDLKSKKKKFNYVIRNKIMMKTNALSMETVHIRGILLSDSHEQEMTVGIWSIHNAVTGEKEDTLLYEIYSDSLTRLMIRSEIERFARNKIEDRPVSADYQGELYPPKNVALCIVDIDNFKQINDSYGHQFGDEVLKEVAAILMKAAGVIGLPGRIGGDEFLLVLEDVEDEAQLRSVLRVIKTGFQWLYPEKLQPLHFGCSIGVAMYPQDARNYEDLFNIADNALYLAKAKGKNRYIIYDVKKHGTVSENEFSLSLVQRNLTNHSMVDLGMLLREFIPQGKAGLPALLESLAKHFGMDRIQIFLKRFDQPAYFYCEPEYPVTDAETCKEDAYLSLFKGGIYHEFSSPHQLEYTNPEIFQYLLEWKIESRFQYLLRDAQGKPEGLIAFDACKNPITMADTLIDTFILVCSVIDSICRM